MLGREPNLGRRVFPTETEMYVVRGECVEEGHLHQIEARSVLFADLFAVLVTARGSRSACNVCCCTCLFCAESRSIYLETLLL